MLFLTLLKAFKHWCDLFFSVYWHFLAMTKIKHSISISTDLRYVTFLFPALKNRFPKLFSSNTVITDILWCRFLDPYLCFPFWSICLCLSGKTCYTLVCYFIKDSCIDGSSHVYITDHFVINFWVYLAVWFLWVCFFFLTGFMDS